VAILHCAALAPFASAAALFLQTAGASLR